jgi:hypothetical protein
VNKLISGLEDVLGKLPHKKEPVQVPPIPATHNETPWIGGSAIQAKRRKTAHTALNEISKEEFTEFVQAYVLTRFGRGWASIAGLIK